MSRICDKHVCSPCCEGTEAGCEQYANVANVYWQVDGLQEIVDDTARGHETGIDGAANDATERVPCRGVKPVPEFLHRSGQVEWLQYKHSAHIESFGREYTSRTTRCSASSADTAN